MKKYDLSVVKRRYKDDQGNEKAEWLNVGALIEKDGKQFIIMDRTFNPAGVPHDGKDGVLISCFEPKISEAKKQVEDISQEPADEIPF